MAIRHFCDRCGIEIREIGWWVALKQEGVYEEWLPLCNRCADLFEKWMENNGKSKKTNG